MQWQATSDEFFYRLRTSGKAGEDWTGVGIDRADRWWCSAWHVAVEAARFSGKSGVGDRLGSEDIGP